ncbi:MAG: uridine kinase, partial [Calditrichia bacterium]|nr:uridine kinase [Calditrichia bacterium]
MGKKGILIGIAGASGSGKTLLANTIIQQLGSDKVTMIAEDSYYKDLVEIPLDQRQKRNFDHPDAFDHSLLHDHLEQLLNGKSIAQPIYDFTTHNRKPETTSYGPHNIVVLEGILIFTEPELRNIMNIKVFIDTPMDICFIRRLLRDIEDRGRTMESVVDQYLNTVKPMYHQFIEPSKRYADI